MALFLLVDFARRQANRHLRQANRHLSQSEQERWEYGHRSLLDSTVTPNTFVDYSKSPTKCSGRVVQLPLVLAEHQPVLEALDHLNGRLVSPPGGIGAADAADGDGFRCCLFGTDGGPPLSARPRPQYQSRTHRIFPLASIQMPYFD